MKTIKLLLSFITVYFFFISCSYNEITLLEEVSSQKQINYTIPEEPIKAENTLIIGYKRNTTEDTKINLRDKYNVMQYETCDCTNMRIEKWIFDQQTDIEGRKEDIAQEGGVEGVEDQFFYQNLTTVLSNYNITENISAISSHIKPNSSDPTIAILDTGVNPYNQQTQDLFLYSNASNIDCNDETNIEISGWDFVNRDNNPFDDHGHGTVVTDIMKSKLDISGFSNYQILPVKVFNELGIGNTFDILCGYLYAVDKPEVKLINMSFGWYYTSSPLLSLFISENPYVLHITSAGNENLDNDMIKHFPSSIAHDNILAIGSYGFIQESFGANIGKSSFSNFGVNNVDFLSRGEQVIFNDLINNQSITLSGTSYATAYVTAIAMQYFIEGYQLPDQITEQLFINATLGDFSLPVKFYDRIIE